MLSRFRVTIRRGLDWMFRFIALIYSTQCSAIANLRALQFTAANISVLSLLQSPLAVSWQQILT
jgi:hypothetical protein